MDGLLATRSRNNTRWNSLVCMRVFEAGNEERPLTCIICSTQRHILCFHHDSSIYLIKPQRWSTYACIEKNKEEMVLMIEYIYITTWHPTPSSIF